MSEVDAHLAESLEKLLQLHANLKNENRILTDRLLEEMQGHRDALIRIEQLQARLKSRR